MGGSGFDSSAAQGLSSSITSALPGIYWLSFNDFKSCHLAKPALGYHLS